MTKYFEYPAGWCMHKQQLGRDALPMTEFTVEMVQRAREKKQPTVENQSLVEYRWFSNGKPYYKVDDAACEMFRRVSIDVPFKYVKVPFDSFCVRFSETCPLRTKFGPLRSMLVARIGKMFAVYVDCGEPLLSDPRTGIVDFIVMHACDDVSVELSLNELALRCEGNEVYEHGLQRDVVSIAISVCFLATSEDKMIRPDVLGKDFAAYLEAIRKGDEERVRTIVERGKRRGKIGYVVDGERELIHHPHDSSEGDPTGRELSHRHVRSAHFRRLNNGVVTWVRQHVVRPDLPAREAV